MSEELLDVIDDNNNVIRVASYKEVHKDHLRHRVTHLLLKNKKGQLLLQKRAANVKAFPLYWTFSAGGHVRSGESFENAIKRETQEELGIKLPEISLLQEEGLYEGPDNHNVYFKTFLSEYDGDFHPNEDVEEVRFVDTKDIGKMKDTERIHPIFLSMLEKYLQDKT